MSYDPAWLPRETEQGLAALRTCESNCVCGEWVGANVPTLIAEAGPRAQFRFVEFFAARIRNANTRAAYMRAVRDFAAWCEHRSLRLERLNPVAIAAYVEELQARRPEPTVKQSLAAIRMLFDWFVTGHVVPFNPASSVRGPRYSLRRGKTPVLDAEQARQLLDSIDTSTIVGLRDRAIIAAMAYTFARVGAVVGLNVEDYYQHGKRWRLRLHEKNGKVIEMGVHHNLEAYLDEYLERAGIRSDRKGPLLRRVARHRHDRLTAERMTRQLVWAMVKRHSRAAGLPSEVCCHTFRATGITTYLKNGGTLEKAQYMAGQSLRVRPACTIDGRTRSRWMTWSGSRSSPLAGEARGPARASPRPPVALADPLLTPTFPRGRITPVQVGFEAFGKGVGP